MSANIYQFLITLFLLLLWFFVLFFVRLRFLLEFLLFLLDVRLLLDLTLVFVGNSREIGSFSVLFVWITTDSMVCVTFCKHKSYVLNIFIEDA